MSAREDEHDALARLHVTLATNCAKSAVRFQPCRMEKIALEAIEAAGFEFEDLNADVEAVRDEAFPCQAKRKAECETERKAALEVKHEAKCKAHEAAKPSKHMVEIVSCFPPSQ